MISLTKIGFGGGSHWCTEAVFQALKGVEKVEQGWIASQDEATAFSEAVIVHFDASQISLRILLEINLRTHKSTSEHSLRTKYRSAIYYFNAEQHNILKQLLNEFQSEFDHQLITQLLPYQKFKASDSTFENYYFKNPKKPFCTSYIDPKLYLLRSTFDKYTKNEKLEHLKTR